MSNEIPLKYPIYFWDKWRFPSNSPTSLLFLSLCLSLEPQKGRGSSASWSPLASNPLSEPLKKHSKSRFHGTISDHIFRFRFRWSSLSAFSELLACFSGVRFWFFWAASNFVRLFLCFFFVFGLSFILLSSLLALEWVLNYGFLCGIYVYYAALLVLYGSASNGLILIVM